MASPEIKNGVPSMNTNGWDAFVNWWKNLRNDAVNWISGKTAVENQVEGNKELIDYQADKNSALAQQDRDFQAQQEATRYQRAAADLRAAGLNPWLAVQGSMSGGAANGAQASVSAGSVSQPDSGTKQITNLASSALSAALIAKIVLKFLK